MINFKLTLLILFLIIRGYNVDGYNPEPRAGHSAILVGNKIFVIGGYDGTNFMNDVFYLDLRRNFTLDNISFVHDDTTPNMEMGIDFSAIAVGGKDNATIFIFGGVQEV